MKIKIVLQVSLISSGLHLSYHNSPFPINRLKNIETIKPRQQNVNTKLQQQN